MFGSDLMASTNKLLFKPKLACVLNKGKRAELKFPGQFNWKSESHLSLSLESPSSNDSD